MNPRALICVAALAALFLFAAASCGGSLKTDINPNIGSEAVHDSVVADVIRTRLASESAFGAAALNGTYRERGFHSVWIESGSFTKDAHVLFEELDASTAHGLEPGFYGVEHLRTAASEAASADDLARLDLDMSAAFLDYATDLAAGRSTEDDGILADSLMRLLSDTSVDVILTGLAPQHEAYTGLQKELERYRKIVAEGGWPNVPDMDVLEPGDTSVAVVAIAERLVAGRFIDESDMDSIYTDRIATAVRAFQDANGLDQDSLYGPNTRAIMNISAEERVEDIRINLERWRQLSYDAEARHVIVNVPEFRLKAIGGDGSVASMKVIVGGTFDGRGTPAFVDRMEYVVFGPYWNIPATIAKEEIMPQARGDDNYLSSNNFEIVEDWGPDAEVLEPTSDNLTKVEAGVLKVRQAPGAGNALGRVKFMFPNQYSVYLHDTSARNLFDATRRDFSHGCIRVEKPVDLAMFVLSEDPEWTESRIRSAMTDGQHETVSIEAAVDVYIVYLTATVDENGRAVFFEDLYDRDARLEQLLSSIP